MNQMINYTAKKRRSNLFVIHGFHLRYRYMESDNIFRGATAIQPHIMTCDVLGVVHLSSIVWKSITKAKDHTDLIGQPEIEGTTVVPLQHKIQKPY